MVKSGVTADKANAVSFVITVSFLAPNAWYLVNEFDGAQCIQQAVRTSCITNINSALIDFFATLQHRVLTVKVTRCERY